MPFLLKFIASTEFRELQMIPEKLHGVFCESQEEKKDREFGGILRDCLRFKRIWRSDWEEEVARRRRKKDIKVTSDEGILGKG